MNSPTTWLAEKTASLLPQVTAAACPCKQWYYYSFCEKKVRYSCFKCSGCAATCTSVGKC